MAVAFVEKHTTWFGSGLSVLNWRGFILLEFVYILI